MDRFAATPHSTRARPRARRVALALLLAAPLAVHAQSAIIYGSLGNFDISNDTGRVCHGFEIQLDGVSPAQVLGSFSAQRYGSAQILGNATGTAVRWQSGTDPVTGNWNERTLPHSVPWFPGQCYSWNAATYQDSGCEHFGTYTNANATSARSHWLCEDAAQPGVLVAVDPPTAVPMPNYYVQPPAQPNNPPELVVEVQAPEPAEAPELYGDAQWIQVFKTESPRALSLDELMADNPAVVPMDPAQLESSYAIIQAEPAAGGNGRRQRHRNQGGVAPTTRSVVRRIEMYAFTGSYDPVTHEALCADGTCTTPAPDEIGELLSVQMTAANVQPDAVLVNVVGSGRVDSSDKLIACGNKCAQPYTAGARVTLTAKAASGNAFSGWSGACAGIANASCTVTANGAVGVTANFVAAPNGGGGGGGGSTFTLQVGKSNSGTVSATPNGTDRRLDCGTTCAAKFAAGTVVTLTATPPAGKSFVSWGGACTGTAATCTVTMSGNLSVQANFSK